jgi:hypothetical protein
MTLLDLARFTPDAFLLRFDLRLQLANFDLKFVYPQLERFELVLLRLVCHIF